MPDLKARVEVRFEKQPDGRVAVTLPSDEMVDDVAFMVAQLPDVMWCWHPEGEQPMRFEPHALSTDNQPVDLAKLVDTVMQTLVGEFDAQEFGGSKVWSVGDFSSDHAYVPRLRAATN